MHPSLPEELLEAWDEGRCVPVLGHQVLNGITDPQGNPIPSDSGQPDYRHESGPPDGAETDV